MKSRTIIIGGGASALMLASLLPEKEAVIIEHNTTLGVKILVSGGGKCNITNAVMESTYFAADHTFVDSVLRRFDQNTLLRWLKSHGLNPVLRKGSQYFCPDSARELLTLLQRESGNQCFFLKEKVLSVHERAGYFHVATDKRTFTAEHVVVASGGLSFPKLGASGIGYEIASSFGHTIVKTVPALVGFTVQKEQFFFKALSGVSTDVVIEAGGRQCSGSLLFTHKGISGPAVLDASLYWEKGTITINFLPGFDWDIVKKSNKKLSSLLPLPKRATKAFLLQFGIEDKAGSAVCDATLRILQTLNRYTFAPAGTFGYSKAEVTKGGVTMDEVNAETMESQKQKGLFFIGEVLDVTGHLGGYNFQWAFSSAYVCASAIKKAREE